MGTLRAKDKDKGPDVRGQVVDGVILGEPAVLPDGTEVYDHALIPSGTVEPAKDKQGKDRLKKDEKAKRHGDVFVTVDEVLP